MPDPLHNPPGQPALAYRLGTHPSFFRDLLARLHTQALPGSDTRPLAALTTRDPSDPAIALLDAWSLVADVLTFYQERIANEGYLRTATEDRSVLELARMLGYELRPGLAASTLLAFNVATAPGMDAIVSIAAGLKVQSIPGQDELPQTFETAEPLDARPEWNLLRLDPRANTLPALITPKDTSVRLAGTNTGLRPEDRMLVTDGRGVRYVPSVRAITPDYASSSTTITWNAPLELEAPSLTNPQLFAFRQQARLFGSNAPRWFDLPPERRPVGGGLYRANLQSPTKTNWELIQQNLPSFPIAALASTPKYLFAGTAGGGVLRSPDQGNSWIACNVGLLQLTISALCATLVNGRWSLYAGSSNGMIFCSTDQGSSWTQMAAGSVMQHTLPVFVEITKNSASPAALRTSHIIAKPPDLVQNYESWDLVGQGLPHAAIRALAGYTTNNQFQLLAATDVGLYESSDNGQTWNKQRNAQFWSIAISNAGKDGQKVWLATDSTIVLYATSGSGSDAPAIGTGLNDIRAIAGSTDRVLVASSSGVTSISLTTPPETPMLIGNSSSSVQALAVDSKGWIYSAEPLIEYTDWPGFSPTSNQASIDLDASYPQAVPGGWIALVNGSNLATYQIKQVDIQARTDFNLSANVTRLTLDSAADPHFFGDQLRTTTVYFGSEQLALYREPAALTGNQIMLDQPIPILPPGRRLIISDQQQGYSESVIVSKMSDQRTIMLLQALSNAYAPASTSVVANVVLATHGETISNEVLGSGDGTQANQQFALKHVPLTYLPAAGDSGDQAELQVRVNGILWSEVPALHQLDQHSQSYIVRRNADQQTRIIFGDGVHGARLPSGQENVVATYRTGLGPQGRVNANSLSLLQTRPLGVQSVNNPLAASGAAGPEKSDSARLNAPLMALTMDRVVALADYEHFVRSYAGIGAAQAALLWAGDTRLIHITVADADGNTLPNGIQLLEELRKALDRRRNRRQPLSIASYQPLKFSISAILFVDPHYQPALVQADVEQALRAYFSFRRRSLAQPAYAAEVIATAQAIPGIVAVDLDAMDRSSNGTALNSVLIAAPAHWDAPTRQVIAAQLLVLDQVILKTQVAS